MAYKVTRISFIEFLSIPLDEHLVLLLM